MADDGEPGRVGTREAAPGDSSPGDDLAPDPSARSQSHFDRLWSSLPAPPRHPERLAALILGLGVLLVALYEGGLAIRAWLHAQPTYQIAFENITLEPDPPPFIKIGKPGILAQIRQRAHFPGSLSVLDFDHAKLGELARSITLHQPWIKSVDEIEIPRPNQLIVRVTYREPVAEAMLARAGRVVLDRDGVVLETSEIDPIAAGSLIAITDLDTPDSPLDPKVGVSLGDSGSEAESRVVSAVNLADFLRRQTRGGPDQPRSPLTFVQISTLDGPHVLSARTSDGLWVRWLSAPGAELPGEPAALAKWSMLTERLSRPEDRIPQNPYDYVEFTRDGAHVKQGVPRKH